MKPTILCVDDEEMVRDSLKDQLRRMFGGEYRIETAESGEVALEIIDEMGDADVPVVMADQIMPGLKGDELLIEVHRRLPRTLKILLTGQATADAVGNAVNHAGLYRYIAKPWERDDLNLTVREAIRRYFVDKQLEDQNRELRALNTRLSERMDAFFRFVPREFLTMLGFADRFEAVPHGLGVDLDLAVLFSDVRDFTPLAETLSPSDVVAFINQYTAAIEPAIAEFEGFIDHFAGDGVMALFPGGADRALGAGVALVGAIGRFNEAWTAGGHAPIQIGVGVNAGRVTLGTLGSASRVRCGVAGDPVNLASRTEGLTRRYGVTMLITHHVVERLSEPGRYNLRPIDRVLVKGRTAPVDLFEVLDAEPAGLQAAKRSTLPRYTAAVQAYYAGSFVEAGRLFAECLVAFPADGAALTFLARCHQRAQDGVPVGWSGVEQMTQK